MTDMAQGTFLSKWSEIWKLFDADEQHDACLCWINEFANDNGAITRRVFKRLAEGTNTRINKMEQQARSEPEKLAHTLRTRASTVLDEESWASVFGSYYLTRKSQMLCAFLDRLGIEHDNRGGIDGEWEPPSAELISDAVEALCRVYSLLEVARYIAVLIRHHANWAAATSERDRLFGEIEEREEQRKAPEAVSESIAVASMQFTVLDRVIVEHIVRTAMQIEGSLDDRQLEELVEAASHLNEKWYRAYFHLGLMDVLLEGRSPRFDHPGDNMERRGWYLAGVIAGLLRSNNTEALQGVFDQRREDLKKTVITTGGAGAAIARLAFRWMVEAGRLNDALMTLRGQLPILGLELGSIALDTATSFTRQNAYDSARTVLEELKRHELEDEDAEALDQYRRDIDRRWGQCLQAGGEFDGAERQFRELLRESEERNSPDLRADLGLVLGKFRSIADVRLPEQRHEKMTMRDALTRGEQNFRHAVDQFGLQSPKAAYALGILAYLRWSLSGNAERDTRRAEAEAFVSMAVAAIQSSDHAATYKAMGALGQALFMQAVIRMNTYDVTQGRDAMAAWRAITPDAGQFPIEDVQMLLSDAEMHSSAFADEIAESAWEIRKDEAIPVLANGPWMTRSPRVRAGVLDFARRAEIPRTERVRIWCSMIPELVKANDLSTAEEGLGELVVLAEEQASAERVLEFFSNTKSYDPAWSRSDVTWAKVVLLRQLGRDLECAEELRTLFFLVRDSHPWEVDGILSAFDEWGLDGTVRDDLLARLPKREDTHDAQDVQQRLAKGEPIRILFVGGNETQARYDGTAVAELRKEWPGVDVHFEHTGWSANWGRDLQRLMEAGNAADAVVLMYMMRTMLGRRLRESLKKPWIPCTSTGKGGMLRSLKHAAVVGLQQRIEHR